MVSFGLGRIRPSGKRVDHSGSSEVFFNRIKPQRSPTTYNESSTKTGAFITGPPVVKVPRGSVLRAKDGSRSSFMLKDNTLESIVATYTVSPWLSNGAEIGASVI